MFNEPVMKNNDQDVFVIEPPVKGEKISLNTIINSAPDGCLIKLTDGEYLIDEIIVINKPVRLCGEGIDKTIITGNGLEVLLGSMDGHDIEIKDISFITISQEHTSVIDITDGKINITSCSFTGGVSSPDGFYGDGVSFGGKAQVSIFDSHFFDNQASGLWVGDNVHATVKSCKFLRNNTGLAVTDNASVEVSNCEFTESVIGFVIQDSATGVLSESEIFKNTMGLMAKGSSTPKISKNKFTINNYGLNLAEKCDVHIEENLISVSTWGITLFDDATALIENNTIQACESGVGAIGQSNTKIYRNKILKSIGIGIILRDDAITHIAENMISENQYGIEVNDDVSFRVENNQIIRNTGLGIYARNQAKGTVQRNIIEKNGEDGLTIFDDATVDFDNYKALVEPGKPVSFSGQNSQITVHAPKDTDKVFFSDLIAHIQPDTEIVLEDGKYDLSDPLYIDKPLKIIAKTIGNVKITGDLVNLLIFEGKGKLSLIGIYFSLESQNQSNVIVINSGELEMDRCTIEGGSDVQLSKRDFGAGLLLHRTSVATVSNSLFKGNVLGISAQGHTSLTLISNKFSDNTYGIVFRDKAHGNSRDNEYFNNRAYGLMVYDTAEASVHGDTCYHNPCGFGFIHNAKAVIEFSEAYEHENHGFFIDNGADVRLNSCKSYSNGFCGFGIYGDSHSQFDDCESYDNAQNGFEIAENPTSDLVNNKIWGNEEAGVLVLHTAVVKIESNEIFKNNTGIHIRDEAIATIENNKIYSHYEEAISNESENESTIGENELYENGEDYVRDEDEESEDNDESVGFNLGNFFANMFGSENISNDPNTIAIPLGHLFNGIELEDDEEYDDEFDDDDEEEDGWFSE